MADTLSLYDVWFFDGTFTGASVYASPRTIREAAQSMEEVFGRRVELRRSGSFPEREGE